jgi:hypothetical protein
MKINIGPYTRWFGPYQLAEALCFWAKPVNDEWGIESKPDWVHNFGEWLAHGSVLPDPTPENPVSPWRDDRPITTLYKFLQWVESKKKRKVKVHIDRWDTWSMDHTLAYIVLPMLEQLKATKHGAPFVDDKDVPKELRSTSAPPLSEDDKDCGAVDDLHFKRWDWVLDEMIFAFRSKLDEGKWEDQFYTGEYDFVSKATEFDENGKPKLYQLVKGPNDTRKIDMKGLQAYQKRISNGFRLFGKYYENLWD